MKVKPTDDILIKMKNALNSIDEKVLRDALKNAEKNNNARAFIKLVLDAIKIIYSLEIVEDKENNINVIIKGIDKIKPIKTNKELLFKEK